MKTERERETRSKERFKEKDTITQSKVWWKIGRDYPVNGKFLGRIFRCLPLPPSFPVFYSLLTIFLFLVFELNEARWRQAKQTHEARSEAKSMGSKSSRDFPYLITNVYHSDVGRRANLNFLTVIFPLAITDRVIQETLLVECNQSKLKFFKPHFEVKSAVSQLRGTWKMAQQVIPRKRFKGRHCGKSRFEHSNSFVCSSSCSFVIIFCSGQNFVGSQASDRF